MGTPDLTSPTEAQIRAALKASRGSVTVAAEALGIHRTWLHRLMRKYGIEVQRVIA
jgi:transcriptional regulator of acetoin/glycerol metabolism